MDQSDQRKIDLVCSLDDDAGAVDAPAPVTRVTRAMPTEDLRIMIDRITARMTALGTNAKQLSRKARLGDTAVYDILNGKNLRPALPAIKAVAKALECDLAYLVGDQAEPRQKNEVQGVTSIPVVGVAEAGAFRKMIEFDVDVLDLPKVHANRSALYPKAKHFSLLVRGDSMNAATSAGRPAPLVEGQYILCVDLTDAGLEIESGKIYAVRRTTDSGQTYECTVKKAMVYRDRYELLPESTNPAHEKFVIPRGAAHRDVVGTQIEVIGLVYGLYSSLEGMA